MKPMKSEIELGYEVGTGELVKIPLAHTCVTGVTQAAGKTTTLEAIISRADSRAITFITKRSESAFQSAVPIRPYFRSKSDWEFVSSLLGSRLNEKLKFQRSWIMKICRGAKDLADVYMNCKEALKDSKRGLDESVYTELCAYFDLVIPELRKLDYIDYLDIDDPGKVKRGLQVMDLSAYSLSLQMLVIGSVLEWIYQHETEVLTVIPEAWEMIPARRPSPVTRAAETLIRKSTAAKNFVLIDSQDAAGISIDVRRQVHVWILGVQREMNEIKRTLEAVEVPGTAKPKAMDIRGLDKGEFFVCWGREMKKVYVRPVWMHETAARQIALGNERAETYANFRSNAIADFDSKKPKLGPPKRDPEPAPARTPETLSSSYWQEKYENESEKLIELDRIRQGLETRITQLEQQIALKNFDQVAVKFDQFRCQNFMSPGPPWYAAQCRLAQGHPGDHEFGTQKEAKLAFEQSVKGFERVSAPPVAFDTEALFEEFRDRLLHDPVVLRVLNTKPEIRIEDRKEVIEWSTDQANGKVAQLVHEGFFDNTRTAHAAFEEIVRRGAKAAKPNVYKICDELTAKGFLYKGKDGYTTVAPAKERIRVTA